MQRIPCIDCAKDLEYDESDKLSRLAYLREQRVNYQFVLETLQMWREKHLYELSLFTEGLYVLQQLEPCRLIFGRVNAALLLPCHVNDATRVELQLPGHESATMTLQEGIITIKALIAHKRQMILRNEKQTDYLSDELATIQLNESRVIAWYHQQEQTEGTSNAGI